MVPRTKWLVLLGVCFFAGPCFAMNLQSQFVKIYTQKHLIDEVHRFSLQNFFFLNARCNPMYQCMTVEVIDLDLYTGALRRVNECQMWYCDAHNIGIHWNKEISKKCVSVHIISTLFIQFVGGKFRHIPAQ